ncbi:MAG TPA: EAL domain-containing protein [Anaerovoracaceae bacterium]|nr:EAL domain-containing protein [Anaerovoracaceae bacterium]
MGKKYETFRDNNVLLNASEEYWIHTSDMSFVKDKNGVYLRASKPFTKMVGKAEPREIIGKTDLEIFEDRALAERYIKDDQELLRTGVPLKNFVEPIVSETDRPKYGLTSKYILKDENNEPIGILGIGKDITVEYEAKQSYERELRTLFDLPEDALIAGLFDITSWRVIDIRYRDEYNNIVSKAGTVDEYFTNIIDSIVEDQAVRDYFNSMSAQYLMKQYRSGKRNKSLEYIRIMPDGKERWVRDEFHFLLDPTTAHLTMVVVLRDIDKKKREYSSLLYAAERDSITSLLNHDTTFKTIQEYIESAKGPQALFMIDLDNFKQINDSFGHQCGDEVLSTVGDVLEKAFRATDIVGRLGGDEFMALMKNAPSTDIVIKKAAELVAALQLSSRSEGNVLEVTTSMGVTIFEGGTKDFQTIYSEADAALYKSKRAGKNRFTIHGHEGEDGNGQASELTFENVDIVQLQTLMEYMDGGIVMAEVTDEIHITYVSPSLFKSFRHTQEKGKDLKQSLLEPIMKEDLEGLNEAALSAVKSDEVIDYSYRTIEHGQLEWRNIRIKSIPDQGDGVDRLVAVVTDITELQRATENLRLTEEKYRIAVEKASREKYQALEMRYKHQENILKVSEKDYLTGLLGVQAFHRKVREILDENPKTKYAIIRFDINRFKVYNDVRGTMAGDELLKCIAEALMERSDNIELAARLESDHFAILVKDEQTIMHEAERLLLEWPSQHTNDFKISFAIGIYRITQPSLDVAFMCDRALIAQNTIKSNHDTKLAYYDYTMRDSLLEEQQLISEMEKAIEEEQFVLYFQPQVNYEDGSLIGAEALVRWDHPTRGLLSPDLFIPLLEQNGMITMLDEYVWERCCRYIHDWVAKHKEVRNLSVAMSVNVSRLDIYDSRLCDKMKELVKKYDLEPSMISLEITESAYMENPTVLIDMVKELQSSGFSVEMDDFGSGYSSLNTLKDVYVDILKLDMKFLESGEDNARGGNIINSIIRMAPWLELPIIAEGVETKAQADYLKSLGCIYMQGYYFSRPMPADEFEELLIGEAIQPINRYKDTNVEGMAAFWDPSVQTALLFNSFVGGAAIMEYTGGRLEASRVNDNYYTTLNTTRARYKALQKDALAAFDEENKTKLVAEIEKTIETGEETGCEVCAKANTAFDCRWMNIKLRVLARNLESSILYVSVENIDERKLLTLEKEQDAERSRLLMQNTGSSFFDYDCKTKTLQYQVYRRDKGLQKRTAMDCTVKGLTGRTLPREGAETIVTVMTIATKAHIEGEVEFRANLWDTGMRWCRMRYTSVEDDDGIPYRIVGQIDDIQDLKEKAMLADSIRNKLKTTARSYPYNDVIVNEVFSIFYDAEDTVAAIERTLALLGKFFGISRVYIFEDTEDHQAVCNTFEWCAPGIPPEKDSLQNLSYEFLGGREIYVTHFDEGGTFYCPNLDAVPPSFKEILEPQGIITMLQCAIKVDGIFTGVVGFDECVKNRPWTDEQVGTLMFVSRVLGAHLLRLRALDK